MRWRLTLICGLSLLPSWAANLRAEPPTNQAAAPTTKPGTFDQPWTTFLGAPATQPATQPVAAAAEPDEQLPVIEAASIQSVVKLAVDNKMLRMTTELPMLPDATLVRIANFPGKTVATVRPIDGAPDKAGTISVRHEMPTLPNQTVIYTLYSLGDGDVRLSVDSEDSSTLRSVQYIQMPVAPENPDPTEKPVRLYVSVTDIVNSNKTVDLKLTADSVIDLRRRYPRETAEYFQPLLATLGQESVPFAVDHRTAWQVLSKHWPIDPKIDEQVQTLIKQLDSDEYATREAASEQLEKLGETAVQSVLRSPRQKLSSEQNSRLDAFLAPYRPLSEDEARRLASDIPFLLDCLYSDAAIRDTAIKQLRDVTGKPVDLNVNASPGAWLTMVRNLRKELLPPPTTKPAAPVPAEQPTTN